MPLPDDVKEEIAARFRAKYIQDQAGSGVRELAAYLADLPPEHQDLIAAEYVAMRGIPVASEPPSSGSLRSSRLSEPGDDVIGPYKILRKLGRGGQATVYLAEDLRLRRQVALKVLDSGFASDRTAFERFRREAAITSKLDHPGICTVHEAGEDRGLLWIAMRYVEGESLAGQIVSSRDGKGQDDRGNAGTSPDSVTGPKTWDEVTRLLKVFEDAARALHAAHEAGVVHRDVKPGNLIVTKEGQPVILDFGLAQEVDGDHPALTVTGDMIGTPAYMSPEQLTACRIRLDRRTDVYSLGISLYECLTLRRPFEAPTREGLYKQILTKAPPDLRSANRSISSDLKVVVETALEKDRDRRYQTALHFAEELRRLRMREPILAKPVGQLVRLQRWAQRNTGLATSIGGLFAVLVAGLTVALFLLSQRDRALEEVTTQRDAKNAALDEKTAALTDYDRLGDLSRLQQLTAEADEFWPCEPTKVPAMTKWVKSASQLVGRLPGHRAVLARLRLAGRAMAPESRNLPSPRPTHSRPGETWQFETLAEEFKHGTTTKLVTDLTAFVDPDPHQGLLADVRARLAFAESVEHETIGKYREEWKQAIQSITASPKYHGLIITPQLGLIPIAEDPVSGLWEFAHLQTTAPGTHPIPKRGADGRFIVTEGMGIVFVLLPGGTFRMGAVKPPDEDEQMSAPNVEPGALVNEGPVTDVTLDPFFISKYEMTQGQWLRAAGKNPSLNGPGTSPGGKIVGLSNPVEQVSWETCDVWLGRLDLMMPTEAQWEYAARAGTTTPRWTGILKEGLGQAANLADEFAKQNGGPKGRSYESWNDGYYRHAPVGSFTANGFGLHDVLGNVFEWCRDWYGGYEVKPRPGDGLRVPSASGARVNRGGGFSFNAGLARSAARAPYSPDATDDDLGLRPARPCR